MKKGLLDACVLYVLQKGDAYGYRLTQEVDGLLEVSESALYPVLRRLEGQGYLETYTEEYSGRLRKYYRITTSGLARYREYVSELKDLGRIIEILSGGDK
jgi:PadR family transcriptional regulator PadR